MYTSQLHSHIKDKRKEELVHAVRQYLSTTARKTAQTDQNQAAVHQLSKKLMFIQKIDRIIYL
jgi:predicted ribosome-associated RNA-binding protein Tma20